MDNEYSGKHPFHLVLARYLAIPMLMHAVGRIQFKFRASKVCQTSVGIPGRRCSALLVHVADDC